MGSKQGSTTLSINPHGNRIRSIIVILSCLLLHMIAPVSCIGVMSIDMGSEWMKVGMMSPGVPMDIVLNAQSQRKTPMAIAFSNDQRFIGETALDIASKYPERTYTHFLDLVGKTIDHDSVKHYKQRFPYADLSEISNLTQEANATMSPSPMCNQSLESLNSIVMNHPQGLKFTPLELVAMMLEHAFDQVSARSNYIDPPTDAVITVPPFFSHCERLVIQQAARLAGLNVLRLTSTNAAFALNYGIFRHNDYKPIAEGPDHIDTSNKTSILFFDQGASHSSATLADYYLSEQEVNGKNESLPTIRIRAQVYDRYSGGFDMQLRLRDHLADAFAKTNGIDKEKIMKRGRSAAKLLKEAGKVKRILSANTEHVARVESVIDDKDLRQPITRQEFEQLNGGLMSTRVTDLLDKLFKMPGVSRDDPIESVIIVGGNTRTPKIQQTLIDYFKLDTLGKSINADEGAALAALYQAASQSRGFRVKKFLLLDSETSAPTPAVMDISHLSESQTKLAHLKEQEHIRLQQLSLTNALESLISEARQKLDDPQIAELDSWMENVPQNLTMLAEKIRSITELIYPSTTTTEIPTTTTTTESSATAATTTTSTTTTSPPTPPPSPHEEL